MRYIKLNRQDRQALVGRLAGMPDFLEATFGTLDRVEAATRGGLGEPSPVADMQSEGKE